MRVKFKRNHTHETASWKKGDEGNLLRELALKLAAEGVVELLDEELRRNNFEEELKQLEQEDRE